MWFLARMYDAQQALQMGLVNTVVPLDQLETETLVWCVLCLTTTPCLARVACAFYVASPAASAAKLLAAAWGIAAS